MNSDLHCGACMLQFQSVDDLSLHLNGCPAGKAMLPLINIAMFVGDGIGHPIAHFIQSLHENADLVRNYAYAVADDMNSFKRAEIHVQLCKNLGLSYDEFRPFESFKIKEIPTREKAEKILWEELAVEGRKQCRI